MLTALSFTRRAICASRSKLPALLTAKATLLALALTAFTTNASATTVSPPEFDSLVQQADYVVRGTVKSVASQWRTGGGHRQIVSLVEIDVAEVIAGTPPSPLVLQMLGGRIGKDEMTVQGSPKFTVGDEHILFIRGNGVQFNPLVALMHGQYPIKKDNASGRREMTRSDGTPLRDEKEVALPMHAAHDDDHSPPTSAPAASSTAQPAPAATSPALTPDEFASRIRASRQKAASTK
jgi:hypothetical protein